MCSAFTFNYYINTNAFNLLPGVLDAAPELADTTQSTGHICFNQALTCNSEKLVEKMVTMGAQIHPTLKPYEFSTTQGNALHITAFLGNIKPLQYLLVQHAQPIHIDETNAEGHTPLSLVVQQLMRRRFNGSSLPYRECAELLINADANVNIAPPGMHILRSLCTIDDRFTTVDVPALLKKFDDIEAPETGETGLPFGTTCFLAAMEHRSTDFLREMILAGADACAVNGQGQNAYSLPSVSEEYETNKKWLEEYSYTTEMIVADLKRHPPSVLEEKFLGNDSKPKSLLMRALSLDHAAPLFEPAYWREHGGIEEGLEFAQRMRKAIPVNRAHLQCRVDDTGLKRELETPNEDSITVAYMRGEARLRGK